MPKFSVYGRVVGSKYIGEVEAKDAAEAEERAWEMTTIHVSMCHQCSDECEDPEIEKIFVEKSE